MTTGYGIIAFGTLRNGMVRKTLGFDGFAADLRFIHGHVTSRDVPRCGD